MVDSSSGQPQSEQMASSPSLATVVAVPATRGKRRRRPLLLVIAAGILWVVGQGLGWFGAEPSGEKGKGGGLGRGATPAALAGAGLPRDAGSKLPNPTPGESGPQKSDLPEGRDQEAGAPKDGQPEETDGPSSAVATGSGVSNAHAGDVGDIEPKTGGGVSADRFASLLSLLESHLSAKELGSASATLQRLRNQALSRVQREQLTGVEARLLPLNMACEKRILEFVQGGEVLAANREAAQLVVGGVWRATQLLTAAPELALASNWQESLDVKAATVPMPAPLLRNRKVRVRFRDELRAGVVASSNRDEVTVRLVSAGGQTYPTVKAVSCEPADSTSSEAVEMGLAAVRAGAPRLARLWMLRAHLLKDELTTRGQSLLELLR
ncbi:MAG: hypothetical protein ACI91B_000792 [Planctomycetota bacterium]|jgi:hypothetical protein